ncbi:hypothetical protein HYALB_00001635 [Hymenoscyphus albidus]|uniref:TFIID subunit TAF5 NTD2 domain-containing protein n=1 Tax=Hymenoscyphus albidus TaxID=595503 RepID=A0A9N9LGG0_9HELO|nr:hypothetical protein HYALB_00001635 [Hymenoscyphus albidus]
MPPPQPSEGSQRIRESTSTKNVRQVIEYLLKKGYNKTEQTLRQESMLTDRDGRQLTEKVEEVAGEQKYRKGFQLLVGWIDTNLDIYKRDLQKLLWPMFVYSYLDMVVHGYTTDAETFLRQFRQRFEDLHHDDLQTFQTIKLAAHVKENSVAKLYRETKYRLRLTSEVYYLLITFLETNNKLGGAVILYLLSSYCQVLETARGPLDQYSFEAIANRSTGPNAEDTDLQEGIEGTFTGVTNKDIMDNAAALKLGMVAMESDLAGDVRAELEDEDRLNPAPEGMPSYVDVFDQRIKREDSPDGPARNDIPYPPSRARDVALEVQKIKEFRDRFKIDSRSGGIGAGISICTWTFHNALDSIICVEFSDDNQLVAVGTQESYIRIWTLGGEPLRSAVKSGPNEGPPTSSRRLIGHAGPVYGISFSPGIESAGHQDDKQVCTKPRYLLSSSADAAVRLWCLETFACLVVYKGHDGPVYNVRWGPFGHYFLTGGRDRTARIWAQDQISCLRLLVGADTPVTQIAWHPNGAYVFSASDHVDKSIRMWSFVTGECVRVFTGHTEFISTLECSNDGKILASADGDGNIILWDINKGAQIKRCRGHGKGGIWSLSFSADSNCLMSGGADGTVRTWEVEVPVDPYKDGEIVGAGGQVDATRINAGPATASQPTAASGAGGKKKGKETMITSDQIAAYPTKKSPVFKVKFNRMNCGIVGAVYQP